MSARGFDLAGLLATAERAAREAGAVLQLHQARLRDGASLGVRSKSSTTDPVSQADREAEARLVDLLVAQRPDDGLLGEEGADRDSSTGLRWVLDPLDGTVNFLYGHVGWAVSVAVEARREALEDVAAEDLDGEDLGGDGWIAVVGVVFEPTTGRMYQAVRGGPAKVDGRALRVNDPVELPRALVATGFDYDPDHRVSQADTVARVLAAARDIRRVGSAALDLCQVASGSVDAYYEDSTRRWDYAAGALIARRAGAIVSPLAGVDGKRGVVAAGPALHDALRSVLTT